MAFYVWMRTLYFAVISGFLLQNTELVTFYPVLSRVGKCWGIYCVDLLGFVGVSRMLFGFKFFVSFVLVLDNNV